MAGGLIDTEYPQLRMQAIVADLRASVAAGQTLTLPMPPGTLGAFSVKGSDQTTALIPLPAGGQFEWTAPSEGSDPSQPMAVDRGLCAPHLPQLADAVQHSHGLFSGPPRDARYSLIDFLDPEATHAFMKLTHETYKQAIGDESARPCSASSATNRLQRLHPLDPQAAR